MSSSLYVLLIVCMCVSFTKSTDLQVGNTNGSQLAYVENVKLASVPFTQRVKNVFYSNDKNQIIRAISAIDIGKSKAKATLTSGGVGSSFVNIKIKGERGEALNYQVQIFV